VPQIADKAIGSDPNIAPLFGRGEIIGAGVAEPVELPAIWQREIDGDPRSERSIRAHVRLRIEYHNNGRTVIEMGVEVPPLVAAFFRADALTILELRHFDGLEAKFSIVGGSACQPKIAVLVASHRCTFLWRSASRAAALRKPAASVERKTVLISAPTAPVLAAWTDRSA
jgi:hypothetical protein